MLFDPGRRSNLEARPQSEVPKMVSWMKFSRRLSLIALVVLSAGCGAHKPLPMNEAYNNELDGAPSWVTKGRFGVEKDAKSKYVYGVGSVGGTRNVGLAREAALGRARTDLARSLQLKIAAMLKDYQSTVTGGAEFGTAAADEQKITDVAKQVTDMTLSGTELVDSWISKNGNMWALCRLDVESFKNTVKQMNQLSESVRRAVEERADKAFEELDKEVN